MPFTHPILIVTPGFPKDASDDTCIPFLQDYVLALATAIGKINVKIIALQYPFTKKKYYWNGIEVYSAGGKNRKGVSRFLTWRRAQAIAGKWIKPGKTIIHTFWLTEATYLGDRLAKKYNCKMVATIMGQDILPANKYLQKINLQKICIVAPNEKARDTLYQTANLQVRKIIMPAVKTIPPINEKRNIDILFVGAFIPLKKPDLFVEIVKQLLPANPAIKCCMIGYGELHNTIKNSVEGEKITQIAFTGQLNREQVLYKMQHAKILLHTSAFEGHATVFSEAIACGMHIVSFDVGGPLHPRRHICRTTKDVVQTIQNLMASELAFTSDQTYSIQQVVKQYIELYQQPEL